VNKALELRPINNAHMLDTRGYIYLKSEQLDLAKDDYEEIFALGVEHAYALLGGGVTYAELGEPERALDLLEQGLDKAGDFLFPDPQLADLRELAEQAYSNLRLPILAQSDECPPACSQANFSGADLPGADLASANLSGADVSETNLVKADLRQADLSSANLSEANLTGANLDETDLSKAVLREAVYDETTIWPPDFDPDDAGALTRDEAIEKYSKQGLTHFDDGDFEAAIADLTKAIELSPNSAEFHFSRGFVYHEAGELEQALANYDRAIVLNPNLAMAYSGRGVVYAERNDLQRAVADLTHAIELDPDDVEAYIERARFYGLQQNFEQTLADLSHAIDLEPDNTTALRFRGMAYARLGKYEQALADHEHAIDLDPTDAISYRTRGVTYLDMADYNEAIADFTQAADLDPNDVLAFRNRGEAYESLGDYEQAISDYTRALELKPDHADTYLRRGWSYANLGDLEQALADLNQAIELDPTNARGYYLRAVIYIQTERPTEAIADMETYLELEPNAWNRETVEQSILELRLQEAQLAAQETAGTTQTFRGDGFIVSYPGEWFDVSDVVCPTVAQPGLECLWALAHSSGDRTNLNLNRVNLEQALTVEAFEQEGWAEFESMTPDIVSESRTDFEFGGRPAIKRYFSVPASGSPEGRAHVIQINVVKDLANVVKDLAAYTLTVWHAGVEALNQHQAEIEEIVTSFEFTN
jgi:tetratricopeptide (TPR) repeat protein